MHRIRLFSLKKYKSKNHSACLVMRMGHHKQLTVIKKVSSESVLHLFTLWGGLENGTLTNGNNLKRCTMSSFSSV